MLNGFAGGVLLLLIWIMPGSPPPKEASKQDEPAPISKPELRQELGDMVKEDQKARFKMIEMMRQSPASSEEMTAILKELRAIDRKHTQRMKEIVKQHGWPTRSMVGADGAQNAWLLVQHADHDRAFQSHCLELMKLLLDQGEVSKSNFAYLTDRVLIGEGKPQRYGTQLHTVAGELVPQKMEDPERVDERRKEMGMEPLAKYLEFARQMQKGAAPTPADGKKDDRR